MSPSQASNNYLAGQIGPANDPLYATDHYLALSGQPYNYCWPYQASNTYKARRLGRGTYNYLINPLIINRFSKTMHHLEEE